MEQSFSEWKVAEFQGEGRGVVEILRNYGLRRIPKAVRQQGDENGPSGVARIDRAVNQGEKCYCHCKAPLCL